MNKEIEGILFDMDLIANHDKVPIYFTQNKVKLLLSYIEQLQQENQQLKKQKDDVVEYIKSLRIYGLRSGKMLITKILNKILRMLGEIE